MQKLKLLLLKGDGVATTSDDSVILTQSGNQEYIKDIAGIFTENILTSGAVKCVIVVDDNVSFASGN